MLTRSSRRIFVSLSRSMCQIAEFVAVLACSLFAGVAVYLSLVEHSARNGVRHGTSCDRICAELSPSEPRCNGRDPFHGCWARLLDCGVFAYAGVLHLFGFFANLLSSTLSRQGLLHPALRARLQVEGVALHFLNDVFRLNLTLESTKSVLY